MIRLCLLNGYFHNKLLLQPAVNKQIITNLKCINGFHSTTKIFAIKLKEEPEPTLEKIYYGPLTPQIKGVKVFSLSSSAAGLAIQPIILKEASTIGSTSLLIAICSVVGFFTFVTPLLLHLITKKYVTEIFYDKTTSTYKAVTINFFLAKKKHEFKVEDVMVPEIPGMFTSMHVKGVPLFVEARHFTDPLHYAKIMGYDKPMDFKLGDTENEDIKK